jgi:predicted outer membrane repeat protein
VRTTTRTLTTFKRCYFEGNSAGSGGALSAFSEQPTIIEDSTFVANSAQSFGGGLDSQYPLVLRNTSFVRNRCSTGTVYLVGTVGMTLENLLFQENVGNLGVGLFVESSEASSRTMTGLRFIKNTARLSGGAIQLSGLAGVTFVDVACQDNEANTAGCFNAAQNSYIEFVGGVIRGNHALSRAGAGAVGDLATGKLTNTVLENNLANSLGGGLMVDGDAQVKLNGTIFRGNRARVGAGLAFTELATACVAASRVQFTNNSAVSAGGAIFFESQIPVCPVNFCSGCSFSQNSAVYGADYTSRPAKVIFVETPASTLAPSERFGAKIILQDAYGAVVKNVRDYIVQVDLKNVTFAAGVSANATIKGLVSVDVNDDGEASFSLIRVQAPPGTRTILTFSTFPVTNDLTVSLAVSECPAGTEAFNQGDYYCLARIDTTREVKIVFIVLGSLAALMAIIFLIIVIVHNKNTVLRKASVPFCTLILVGGIVMYSSVYMFLFNTDATCALRPWLLLIGFALCYGSLFIKEWRLFRLFDPNINARVRVRDLDLLKGLSLLVGAELGFLIIWFAISPFILDVSANLTAETITYQCSSKATSAVFWVLVAFNGLVLVMGCIIAFLIRNLPDNWNESRYMAFSIYTVTLTIIVCLAICGSLYQPNLVSLVASIGIIFSTTATLLGLFVPKFLFIFFKAAMRESLITDIDKLYQDVRWKQHQLQELDSKSRLSATGSDTGATQTIDSVNSYNPSLMANQGSINSMAVPSFMSWDNRSMASMQAVASPSVAMSPLTNRTGTEDSDDTPKRSKTSKSSVRAKSVTSASSRSKTSASSVKRKKQESSESEMSSQVISSDSEEEAPKSKKASSKRSAATSSVPKKSRKQESSSSSSEAADSSDEESS